ncbi:ABC transporter substrate-binding protein [Bacillus velezensis]|uniref:ABC transporter substrate-binding protein n=1 Tax=Bacillus velezensis TaxID=492670 RepID=UPI002DBE82A1|nr:ABC transporter substrate-binding protein [Bacillus velezensis]MEC1391801.1 ABC transporter substrate-binding protein [Bacillus velezensis]
MKRLLALFLSFTCLILPGCSAEQSGAGEKQKTLTVYSTISSDSERAVFRKLADSFQKEHPDIQVNVHFPGNDYENMMRVRMAAGDMPDLFDTHGWAKIRYGEYTADLSGMSWTKRLDPNLNSMLKDAKGRIYAFPLNQAKDGLAYNRTLLEKYRIKPPETMDDFMKALRQIKEKSGGTVTPFWFAGYEKSSFAQYYDQFAAPLLITDPAHRYKKQLLNGTFRWTHFTYLSDKLKEMQKENLLNIDAVTAKRSQLIELMAQNKIAFTLQGGTLGQDVAQINPKVKVGIIPTPAVHKGDAPVWIGGERYTLAAFKDSPRLEEAKQFIAFMARPGHAKSIAEATSLPAGLVNVQTDIFYANDYKHYQHIKVQPYFDRLYLPNGMWDVMGTAGQELMADILTPAEISAKLGREYKRLRLQSDSQGAEKE